LADILRENKQYEEAERLYQELIDGGLLWDREHADNRIGESYAVAAYRGRLQIALACKKDNASAVETLLDEVRKRLPIAEPELQQDIELSRQQAASIAKENEDGAQRSGEGSSGSDSPVDD
jgi:hypothetical protein